MASGTEELGGHKINEVMTMEVLGLARERAKREGEGDLSARFSGRK